MFLLAEATPVDPLAGWGQLAVQFGVAVILAWYLYYTTAVTFPNISNNHLSRIDTICANHDKALGMAMDKFSSELKEERDFHRSIIQGVSCKFQK